MSRFFQGVGLVEPLFVMVWAFTHEDHDHRLVGRPQEVHHGIAHFLCRWLGDHHDHLNGRILV